MSNPLILLGLRSPYAAYAAYRKPLILLTSQPTLRTPHTPYRAANP